MATRFLRKALHSLGRFPALKRFVLAALRTVECAVFGGPLRERFLVAMLGALHRSQYRREWRFSELEPHFYNQRWNGFELTYGRTRNAYPISRGFLAAQVIETGDRLLDVGCGDGFFSSTFFSERCSHIDAIDIEQSAIAAAQKLNSNPKIDFRVLDAVQQPFPRSQYDVIVWDGAIGHFERSSTDVVLGKIAAALAPRGIFVGSESLGHEGSDHLQFFEQESNLAAILRPHFKHCWLQTIDYPIGGGIHRREAYWRCANDDTRHRQSQWVSYS